MNFYEAFTEKYKHLAERERQSFVHVHLKLVKQSQQQHHVDKHQTDIDEEPGEKEDIEYDESIHNLEKGSRLLFVGRPGIGKSTLMEKISCHLANKNISHADATKKFVILVRLRQLDTDRNPDENDLCSAGCILKEDEKQINFDQKDGENIIFIFDGFDEYALGQQENNFVHRIIDRGIFPNSIVIVSSRPRASHVIRKTSNMKLFEVVGFNDKNVFDYIGMAFKDVKQKHDSLIAHLTKHPKIMNMCHIPLYCFILAHLQSDELQLPQTESDFYKHFTLSTYNCFIDGLRNILEDGTQQQQRQKVGSFQKLKEEIDFKNVCQFAYEMTCKSYQVFQEDDLVRAVVGSFFVPVGAVGKSHSFIHLSFQEYLTAIYIAWYCNESERENIVPDPDCFEAFNNVWQFLFVILDHNSFSRIREAIESDHLLHVHCAYESRENKACTEVFVYHKGSLKFQNILRDSTDITCISYVLRNADHDPNIKYNLQFRDCDFSKDDAQKFLEAVGSHQISLEVW